MPHVSSSGDGNNSLSLSFSPQVSELLFLCLSSGKHLSLSPDVIILIFPPAPSHPSMPTPPSQRWDKHPLHPSYPTSPDKAGSPFGLGDLPLTSSSLTSCTRWLQHQVTYVQKQRPGYGTSWATRVSFYHQPNPRMLCRCHPRYTHPIYDDCFPILARWRFRSQGTMMTVLKR